MHAVSRTLRSVVSVLAVAGLFAMLAGPQAVSPVGATTNPCEAVPSGPPDPIEDPEPTVGGVLVNATTQARISGATVHLYQCDEAGNASLFDTETSMANGFYSFADLERAYYYVEVAMTGPLAGMEPAAGTQNPSHLVAVGLGDPNVDFDFE